MKGNSGKFFYIKVLRYQSKKLHSSIMKYSYGLSYRKLTEVLLFFERE